MKTNILLLTFTVDMDKMSDYQLKQFLKYVKKRVKNAMDENALAELEKTSINIGDTHANGSTTNH